MSDQRLLLVVGAGAIVTLILLESLYGTGQLRYFVYVLVGLFIIFGGTAAILWAARLERKAKRSDELDHLKSEFVSRVSHELRTPLTTIKALTRLLLRGEVSEQKRREYLETISIECDRQIDMILNLLDLSRIEGGVFRLSVEKVEAADVISSCVKSEIAAAERRSHKLQVKPIGDLPPICADPKHLRRVFSNLIENSIKYTPDGGSITLSAELDGDNVALRVTDNGRGIPKADLPVLFDKFYRGDPAPHSTALAGATSNDAFLDDADVSGVGLGLYLARDVLVRMGGKISVETEVGVGSTFTVHLPVWAPGTCGKTENEVKGNARSIVSG
ncbi:MAG: HAMP domain-containing histidine kinase [Acidobacteria bacterium]|nr:HAMP domain-containing histidine kinase [Acidobacteriota bacterium]